MNQVSEQMLNDIRNRAKSGDGYAEYELAMLFLGDYFKFRAIYTVKALYKGFLRVYESVLKEVGFGIEGELTEYYEAFRNSPSQNALDELIVATIQKITSISPLQMPAFSSGMTSGLVKLSYAIVDIVNRHFPEYQQDKNVYESVNLFVGQPSIDTFYNLIDSLTLSAKVKKDKEIIKKLLADAALKGVTDALKPLSTLCGYKSFGTLTENGTLLPIFSDDNNIGYPSIFPGFLGGEIKVSESKRIKYFQPFDFLHENVDFNHFISISYNRSDTNQRKTAENCIGSLMASLMAWAGPQRFSLDVVDYEHTGIGAYPAQFLPDKQVKIIVRADEWEKEINSLERIIEKRSKMMQSIFDYNRKHNDATEPYKIVVMQDYEGTLIMPQISLLDHPSPIEKEKNDKLQRNAERFKHLLERGYGFGIIFIVVSSNPAYQSSFGTIECDGKYSFGEPYSFPRINGVSTEGEDWLMKWLATGNESSPIGITKDTIKEISNGSDGVLTTELTDDGDNVEFQLDTVGHTHAFVIGKTGTGKSVLLHNIITGLISKYSPEDLMLYLIDLKEGGVEFSRYKEIPHLRSLLVDNSDVQIVLEIMRDIDSVMKNRGKMFRKAGVTNIKEYNRSTPDHKLPQVIVVIDECHHIFSMGSNRSANKEQREITEYLAKISKEGRSQGIHLIFATQTLSGSDIPSEIQKNITDYFLLKCAPGDSESLVRGSSRETEALSVGKVYYYHSDKQALFQGRYIDNPTCERLISKLKSRFEGNQNHGKLYFNGSQTFQLNTDAIETLLIDKKKGLYGTPGRLINLHQTPVKIVLKQDFSENVLISGINSEGQSSRIALALLGSQIAAARKAGDPIRIDVINCYAEDSDISKVLEQFADNGYIRLYRSSESEDLIKNLCLKVFQKIVARPTILYILGQDRFGELKRNQKFKDKKDNEKTNDFVNDLYQGLKFELPLELESKSFDSFHTALIYLLENGPLENVHTVIQLEKVSRLLFEEYISAKIVRNRFKHLIVSRCDMRSAMSIGLSDELKTDSLSADSDRLRAFYDNDDTGETVLFSPYELIKSNSIDNILKQ